MSVLRGSIAPAIGPGPQAPSLWALPFDTLRALHASGVQAGFIRPSMLESRDFERIVGALERALLGPLARRV